MPTDFRTYLPIAILTLVTVGCGGGGGGVVAAPTPEETAELGTAIFTVNTASGKVQIKPLDAGKGKSAIIGGSGITFETTELLAESGEVGRRSIRVKLKNNLQETIGGSRPIRISFGPLSNQLDYATDLRSLNTVSTPLSAPGGSTDGPVGSATIQAPYGVVTGQDGTIYFSTTDGRIRALKNNYVSTVATNMLCNGISYVKDAMTGREYIVGAATTLSSIKSVNIASGSVTTLAGLDNNTGNVNGAASTARFLNPYDIQPEPGYGAAGVFNIADYGNNSVRTLAFTFSGGNLVAGVVANRYTGLTGPTAVSTATNKSVAVVENGGNRIRIYNNGSSKEALIGTGVGGDAVGSGNVAQFAAPVGVVAVGNAFLITESAQIKRISLKSGAAPLRGENWLVSRVAGNPGFFGTTDGIGTVALFDQPRSLALEATGTLLTAEPGSNRIRRILTAGTFDFGTPDGTGSGGAMLVNQTGDADLNGAYRPYIDVAQEVAPGQTVSIGEWQFAIPSSVPSFTFVVQVEAPTSVYAGLEAVLNPGAAGGPGSPSVGVTVLSNRSYGFSNGNITNAQFGLTYGSKSDAAGNVYITDQGSAVRRIGADGFVSTVAGNSTIGTVNGIGSVARFNNPTGVWCNPAGTVLVVVDSGSSTIRYISRPVASDPKFADSWTVSTIAGTATPGDSTGVGAVAQFRAPFAIVSADGETFYVSEIDGHRISQVSHISGSANSAASYYVDRLAGSPTAVSGYINATGNSAKFSSPYGLALTRDHKLLVSDYNNSRIRAVSLDTKAVTDMVGNGTAGLADNNTALLASTGASFVMVGDDAGAVYFAPSKYLRRYWNGGVKTVVGNNGAGGRTGQSFAFTSDIGSICPMPGGDLMVFAESGMVVRLSRIIGNRQ